MLGRKPDFLRITVAPVAFLEGRLVPHRSFVRIAGSALRSYRFPAHDHSPVPGVNRAAAGPDGFDSANRVVRPGTGRFPVTIPGPGNVPSIPIGRNELSQHVLGDP